MYEVISILHVLSFFLSLVKTGLYSTAGSMRACFFFVSIFICSVQTAHNTYTIEEKE